MIQQKTSLSIYALLAFFLVALFWNLGVTPIGTDEPTRTVVAQEILLSNNWFLTSINGEPYYNKPPLYNWILIGLYKITGSKSEFVIRIPVVLSLIGMMATIFFWMKEYIGKKNAFLAAIIFATGSRIWFYDSFLGLIDMFFGLLIVWIFILVYELEKRKKYFLLFILTYLITALCFLMKGLQAIAFQGVTLLVWFVYKREFKRLFGLAHFSGILVFVSILGLYLWVYNQYHPVETLLNTLWSESSKRTVGGRAWYEDLWHIFAFPFKNVLLDLMPWGLFLLALVKKEVRKMIFSKDYYVYIIVIVLANSVVYWLSPETRGRYLFPHYALLSILIVAIIAHYNDQLSALPLKKVTQIILFIMIIGASIMFFLISFKLSLGYLEIFIERRPFYYGIAFLVFCFIGLLLLSKKLDGIVYSIVLILLAVRFVFDGIVVPQRLKTGPFEWYKNESIRIAREYNDKELVIYSWAPLEHSSTHYLTLEQNRIIPRVDTCFSDTNHYYILDAAHFKTGLFILIDSFPQNWEQKTLYVAKKR